MNTAAKNHMDCPVCGAEGREILAIEDVPLFCNILLESEAEAERVRRVKLSLTVCESCGHMYNRSFDSNLLDYAGVLYENRLDHSPYYQDYARFLAAELITRFSLRGKRIVELGCGSGEFLRTLCEAGKNEGFGFDPSFNDETDLVNGVKLFRGQFTPEYSSLKPEFVFSRQVLEHVHSPAEFLREIVKIVGNNSVGIFAEVPNSLFILRDLSIWDLIYEHYSYFSPISLKFLFKKAGIQVRWASEEYGGQFLCVGGFSEKGSPDQTVSDASWDELFQSIERFASLYKQVINSWSGRIREYSGLVLWGAGSKGVSFLNLVPNSDSISHVVDINPKKQGKFVPCTGHRVISPEDLVEVNPNAVLVMNPLYFDEIRSLLAALGLDPELLSVEKAPSIGGPL